MEVCRRASLQALPLWCPDTFGWWLDNHRHLHSSQANTNISPYCRCHGLRHEERWKVTNLKTHLEPAVLWQHVKACCQVKCLSQRLPSARPRHKKSILLSILTNHCIEIHQISDTEICQTRRRAPQTGWGYSTRRYRTCNLPCQSTAPSCRASNTGGSLWILQQNSYRRDLACGDGVQTKGGVINCTIIGDNQYRI